VDLLCSRGVSELVAERIEAIVAPCLPVGPGVDAVGSPRHGSLEVGVPIFLPHAAAVMAGLVDLGFRHIFVVCHHQGSSGEEGAAMKLVAQHYGLNFPSRGHPHWWGALPPDAMVESGQAPAGATLRGELPSTSITVLATTEGRGLISELCGLTEFAGGPVDHGGFWETSSIQALCPSAVDLRQLEREDTPWFALPGTTGHEDGPRGCREEFSVRLIDAFAATLAEEVLLVCSGGVDAEALPPEQRAAALFTGCAQPTPSALRERTPHALRLDEMRPGDIQSAASRDVPLLLPVGAVDLSLQDAAEGVACGAELLAVREACEAAAEQTEAIVAPPLSYGPPPGAGAPSPLEGDEGPFVPMLRAVLRGLVRMGFGRIVVVVSPRDRIGAAALGLEAATEADISVLALGGGGELRSLLGPRGAVGGAASARL